LADLPLTGSAVGCPFGPAAVLAGLAAAAFETTVFTAFVADLAVLAGLVRAVAAGFWGLRVGAMSSPVEIGGIGRGNREF
jgi:hypothetical protein